MEDKIKELASNISILQIRNERLEDELKNNNNIIERYTKELNELLEENQENKKSN